jgi:hypothetical protein
VDASVTNSDKRCGLPTNAGFVPTKPCKVKGNHTIYVDKTLCDCERESQFPRRSP